MGRYYQEMTVGSLTNTTMCDFQSPGAYTFTTPSGITELSFEIWGAGGGGGAKCCCDCYHGGPPAGGGGYSAITVSTTPGTSYSICVGAGGMVPTVGSCTIHWCCQGQSGQTTYITGGSLSNFCATGGTGGNNDCYYFCGCNIPGGIGYGGSMNACGGYGAGQGYSDSYAWRSNFSGGSPFGGGSRGGRGDWCCVCMNMHPGIFPGGGGMTANATLCCCCAAAGVGANGMVRIRY